MSVPLPRTMDGGVNVVEAQSLPQHLNLKDVEETVRSILGKVRRGDIAAVARWHSLDCP